MTEESILAVQIFDQKKFKKKDQGFLGVVNVRIGNVIDLDAGGDGTLPQPCCRDMVARSNIAPQRCLPATSKSQTTT